MRVASILGVVACAFLSVSAKTSGATYYFNVASGNWNDSSLWRDSGGHTGTVPGYADRAVFPTASITCTVPPSGGPYYIDTIDVEDSATLTIDFEATLVLSNYYHNTGNPRDNSHIATNGLVQVNGDGDPDDHGTLRFTKSDHVIDGGGELRINKYAELQIAYDLTVTSELVTRGVRGNGGRVKSYGTGTNVPIFRNEGIAAADTDTPGLEFTSTVGVEDIGGAAWNVDGADTVPEFDSNASLKGDFHGHCAGMVFTGFSFNGAVVATSGKLVRNGTGLEFTYLTSAFTYIGYFDGDCPSGCMLCGNPVSGSSPWSITYPGWNPCTCTP